MPSFSSVRSTILPKGKMVYEYNPLYNYRPAANHGLIDDLITSGDDQLNFDLEHPVDIECQKSYDGSVNLILNDNKNLPRLINTRFTALENNTYERVDRTGNTDTNLYDELEFEIDTSLLKKYINIPKVNFEGVYYGGNLMVGNYVFYFKLSDGDGNETDIVAESSIVTIHMGALNDPTSIRGGSFNENSGKSLQFILSNIDSSYDYVSVYYSRTSGAGNSLRSTQAFRVTNRFRIRQGVCSIHITGNENIEEIPVYALSLDFFLASAAKTQAQCLNMLFLGNVKKFTPEYELLAKLSLGFLPYYVAKGEAEELGNVLTESYARGGYYNVKNIYNKVGYWNEEIYRFGVVYILSNGELSPVYNIRGTNNVPALSEEGSEKDTYIRNLSSISIDYDTKIINNITLENAAGVCRIYDNNSHDSYFQVRKFVFKMVNLAVDDEGTTLKEALKKLNIKGYFFVRQKRIPTILCQAFMLGKDTYSGIPAWQLKNGSGSANTHTDSMWVTESFLDSRGYVTHDYSGRLVTLDEESIKNEVGICPEFELNQPYYNNIFTGNLLRIKPVSVILGGLNGTMHHIYVDGNYPTSVNSQFIAASLISVPDGGLIRDNNSIFRNIAGSPNEVTFLYLVNKNIKPSPSNFLGHVSTSFVGGTPSFEVTESSSVKIVRGLYGPYVGVYNTTLIKPNSLINIYIPGYDSNQMYEYFKIRVNDESPYFAISERALLDDFDPNGESIYRGDCYISLFTHRINRNFLDPDAPNNETIVDEATWVDKYDEETDATDKINRGDLNAVRMGTYVTIKCYTSTNIAMRDWDVSYPGEESLTGNKRSFYPLSGLRIDGNSKIPQSFVYNLGFSSTTGERMNFLLPTVPYIKNVFLTRVIYSDIAQTDAFKNGFRVFKGISHVDYSNQYGGITKLVEWKGNLIIVFEHAIALAAVNEKALIPTDDGTQIAVGAVKPLATTPVMISTDFGSLWPDSICKTENYIYGVDTVGKKIWRTNGQSIEFISDSKVLKFLNDNITLTELELTPIIGVRNVKTHYNAFKHDIMFTYYDNTYGFEEKVWNLCFNEYQKTFVTFYSWIPSYSANIDNIFFSYDRNASKWIAKLNQSTYGSAYVLEAHTWKLDLFDGQGSSRPTTKIIPNNNASGVCMYNPLIPRNGVFSRELFMSNIPLPEGELNTNYYLKYDLIRDNFGFYKFFEINGSGGSYSANGESVNYKYTLKIKDGLYDNLLRHWFLSSNNKIKDPIIPCVLLNIKCTIFVPTDSIDPNGWDAYLLDNAGYYESQVFITLYDIYSNYSRERNGNGRWQANESMNHISISLPNMSPALDIALPTFETAFWKHGLAGIIDIKDRIKPCFWYGKQHPFEFEYVTGNDNAGYKQFDNLTISSNNVAPESIHYTIVGDSYDFSLLKPAMYFRQEATKAFYQYNGSDILYDHTVFDKNLGYLPNKITTDTYIERDLANNPLRHKSTVSTVYKDTLLPLIYSRLDTFNEVEDFYKRRTTIPSYADYPNLTGGEIQWDSTLDQFSICNHVKCRDIKEVGRVRGNIQYVNDKWQIQITPLNVLNRNDTWGISTNSETHELIELPKLVVNNVPADVYNYSISSKDFPPELGVNDITDSSLLGNKGFLYSTDLLDTTNWQTIANARKEVKLLDKVLKTRIRYKGDKLAIILATATSFNSI